MQGILDFLNSFVTILFTVLTWALDALIWILVFSFKILISGLFTIVYSVISALDVGSILVNLSSQWGGLDSSVAYILNQTGIPTGLSMLGAAYAFRFVLNLIPAAFTRI